MQGAGSSGEGLAGGAHVGSEPEGEAGGWCQAAAIGAGFSRVAGPPFHGARTDDLAGAAIDNADIEGDVIPGFQLLLSGAKTKQAEVAAGLFVLHVVVVGREGAQHDVAGAGHLALFGGVAALFDDAQLGQLLLRQHLLEVAALHHLEIPRGGEFIGQGGGQVLGHRSLPPPGGLGHRVLELRHGHRGLGPGTRRPGRLVRLLVGSLLIGLLGQGLGLRLGAHGQAGGPHKQAGEQAGTAAVWGHCGAMKGTIHRPMLAWSGRPGLGAPVGYPSPIRAPSGVW